MKNKHPLIERAITICGGQVRLAEKAGVKQQTISKILNRQQGISAEVASKIHIATKGAVSRAQLRPDLFEGEAA